MVMRTGNCCPKRTYGDSCKNEKANIFDPQIWEITSKPINSGKVLAMRPACRVPIGTSHNSKSLDLETAAAAPLRLPELSA
eukprot:6184700-Pleurochrysis_carterae.AAC.2